MNHFLNELNEKTIDERNLTYVRCNLNDTQGTCNIDRLKNHTLVSIYNPSYQKN
jgi:hypothetical protein